MINLNNLDICNSLNLENSISQYKFKDVIELPYIQFPQTRNLPAIVGIYVVIAWLENKERGGIVYIGETINLKERWCSHDHRKKIKKWISDSNITFDIFWCDINTENKKYLIAVETELIWHFQPMWNMEIRHLRHSDDESGHGWKLQKIMAEKHISSLELSQKTGIRSYIIESMMLLKSPPKHLKSRWVEKISQALQCFEYELCPSLCQERRITLEDFEYLRPVAFDFISAYIKKGYRWRGVYSLNEKFNLYIQEFSFCTEIECFSADFYEYLKLANFEVKRENNGAFVAKVIFSKKKDDY
jgi:hypothetical protein